MVAAPFDPTAEVNRPLDCGETMWMATERAPDQDKEDQERVEGGMGVRHVSIVDLRCVKVLGLRGDHVNGHREGT